MRESTLRELTLRLKNAAPTLQLEENADMARYTTLHLGGPADLMANTDDPAQIPLMIETARHWTCLLRSSAMAAICLCAAAVSADW